MSHFECPVCFIDMFDPRCLQCGHMVCLQCLEKFKLTSGQVSCPLCNELHNKPAKTTPKVIAVSNYVENKNPKQPIIQPKTCDEHSQIIKFYCRSCQSFCCDTCFLEKHNGHPIESFVKERFEMFVVRMNTFEVKTLEDRLATFEEMLNQKKKEINEKLYEIKGRQAQLTFVKEHKFDLENMVDDIWKYAENDATISFHDLFEYSYRLATDVTHCEPNRVTEVSPDVHVSSQDVQVSSHEGPASSQTPTKYTVNEPQDHSSRSNLTPTENNPANQTSHPNQGIFNDTPNLYWPSSWPSFDPPPQAMQEAFIPYDTYNHLPHSTPNFNMQPVLPPVFPLGQNWNHIPGIGAAAATIGAAAATVFGNISQASTIQAPRNSASIDKQDEKINPKVFDINPHYAMFFIIKSYSEDDVYNSTKFGLWCSTEHGNKKLDHAYRNIQGKGPTYLLFSVNGSGHFCGLAEMKSPVDFSKDTGCREQDKWKGRFDVKWIYIKDVPNAHFRHIRLESNENKPVTQSRDTQEVPLDKGRMMLRILSEFKSKTSFLDDTNHYEARWRERNEKQPYLKK